MFGSANAGHAALALASSPRALAHKLLGLAPAAGSQDATAASRRCVLPLARSTHVCCVWGAGGEGVVGWAAKLGEERQGKHRAHVPTRQVRRAPRAHLGLGGRPLHAAPKRGAVQVAGRELARSVAQRPRAGDGLARGRPSLLQRRPHGARLLGQRRHHRSAKQRGRAGRAAALVASAPALAGLRVRARMRVGSLGRACVQARAGGRATAALTSATVLISSACST